MDKSSNPWHRFDARYYDPQLGRWTQQDPVGGSLGDLGSANRYVYAGDDPVNLVDPSGKSCFLEALGAIAGVASSIWSISVWMGGLLNAAAASPIMLEGMVAEAAFVMPTFGEFAVAAAIAILALFSAYAVVTALQTCSGGQIQAPF